MNSPALKWDPIGFDPPNGYVPSIWVSGFKKQKLNACSILGNADWNAHVIKTSSTVETYCTRI